MDYQVIADGCAQIAVVVSINLSEGDEYGKLRLVAANNLFAEEAQRRGGKFIPGMLYTDAMDRDPNFESLCLQCIIEKKALHSYVDAPVFDAWLSLFFFPLKSDEKNVHYCLFSYELDKEMDPLKLADTAGDSSEQVLKACLRLWGAEDYESAMNSIVDDIRDMCDADYCCILLTNDEKRKAAVLSESIRGGSGMLPMETYLDDDFYNIIDSWPNTMSGSNCICISDEHGLNSLREINPVWAASLEAARVKCVVLFPLRTNKEMLGYIWVINFDTGRTSVIKEILEETSFILSSEIANHNMYKKLEKMSRTDLLTGVYNRNAMNNRIDSLKTPDSAEEDYGVVFADLNGLKQTNDTHGHASGDRLLKAAAAALRKHFDGYEVYRAGGDEFMIYAPGISEADFQSRINALKLLSDDDADDDSEGVSFAIGSCFGKKGTDIRKALHEADQLMYKDKNVYYEENPGLERRM